MDIGLSFPYHISPAIRYQLTKIETRTRTVGKLFYENQITRGQKIETTFDNMITYLQGHPNTTTLISVLQQLINKKGSYSKKLKSLALYIYIHVGSSFYNFIEKNFLLPSLTTVRNYLRYEFSGITEGHLRVSELKCWLQKHKLPNKVWISEDATRIIRKVR